MLSAPTTAIIVVAAGSGTRLGADLPKALVPIDHRTVLRHALDGVFAAEHAQVVVVAPSGYEDAVRDELLGAAGRQHAWTQVVTGGETRQRSVAAGLAVLADNVRTVLVHDAARAFTPPAQINAIVRAVEAQHPDAPAAASSSAVGVIPTLAVIDTLKQVDGDEVVGIADRSRLGAAQTPQGFPRAALVAAYDLAAQQGVEYTDDAALFAAAGHRVRRIEGSDRAFKITTPHDLSRARHVLAGPSDASASVVHDVQGARHSASLVPRVGVGTDVHAFAAPGSDEAGGNLWLAGLEWPGETPLSGHSDGDAVAHAIVDALLAAAGLGDIGQHFGTAHPEYAGAHADVFLARTAEMLQRAGFTIGNVSVQFQATRPRFSARRAEAEQALSAALGGAPVSVSATTTDGLGFTGRTEGIAVTAVAIVFAGQP